MRVEDYPQFEKDMQAFNFKFHQDLQVYLKRLADKGWATEDARQWVNATLRKMDKDRRQSEKNRRAYERKMMKCPQCGEIMILRPVNIDAKTQTGDPKDKSVWICPNEKCMHTIYDERHMKEILGLR